MFPARLAWFLDGRWRRLVLSPERLQQQLALSPDLTVLEIGAGGGNYARPLSTLVRRFIALDLQAPMLHRLRRSPRHPQLLSIQGDARALPLADRSVDVILAITVLGEVPSPATIIAEAGRVLRPGGVLSVSEHWPDPDFVPFATVRQWCRAGGFSLKAHHGGRFNYTATFASRAAHGA